MVAVIAVAALFVGRLVVIQFIDADAINAEAEGRRGVTITQQGLRGDIVASDGTVLADSSDRFDVTASPKNAESFERTLEDGSKVTVPFDQAIAEVSRATGVPENDMRASLASALEDNPDSEFAYLARRVTYDQYMAVRALKVPWIYFEHHPVRTYPNGALAGNLTGFVGADGEPLAGLELGENDCLAGQDGKVTYERGADGVPIPGSEVTEQRMQPGGDLQLSIDPAIQYRAQQVLATEATRLGLPSGHVTVMEVRTGRIVALAEYPSLDPNNPELVAPEMRGSRVFTAPFEPGSTLKPLTVAMAFDRGVATVDEVLVVPDTFNSPDGASFSDDQPHPPEKLTTAGIIAESSNVGIGMIGERVPAADRYNYLHAAGLGRPTEIGFLGEESGTVHPYTEWDPQTNYATMFGQGLEVTGVQMASIYQMLGNGGVRLPVSLVDGCRTGEGTLEPVTEASGEPRRVVSPEAASQALSTIEAAAQSGSNRDTVKIDGYRVGVKTGTAQLSDGQGQYVAGRYIISMAGIAPIDDPQYVVTVTFMPGATMTPSSATAPTWHDIMAYTLQSRGVAPSPEPWQDIPVTATP